MAGISNADSIEEVQQHVSSALVEYTSNSGSSAKFAQLLLKLPDIKLIGVEIKQLLNAVDADVFNGTLLDGCLLGEMLYGPSASSAAASMMAWKHSNNKLPQIKAKDLELLIFILFSLSVCW